MLKIETEAWNGHSIRVIEDDTGCWRMAAEDAAQACGYAPLHMILGCGECIIDRADFGDACLVLTSNERTFYVTDFYGDSDHVLVPNVCRSLEEVCTDGNYRAAFMNVLLNMELRMRTGFTPQSPVVHRLYDALGISPGDLFREHQDGAQTVH